MATEIEFFTDSRRELELGDFHSLRTTGNERRVKSQMRIPLSNRSMLGIPSWVSDGHALVVRDKSFYTKTVCKDVRMEGITIEFFTTDTIKRKMRTLNGCTLDKFSVERVGKDDKAQTFLNFIAYCPCSLEVIQFFYEMQGATTFAQFDTTQAKFTYDGEEEPEDLSDQATIVYDPNDNPDTPIEGDTREVIEHGGAPQKSSHKKRSK